MPNQTKKKRKKKLLPKKAHPLRSLLVAFAFTCLAVYLIITAIGTGIKINETNEKIKLPQSEYNKIVTENKDTQTLLKNANENDIIERIARERLGYVFPDEKVYVDVN